MDNNSLAHTKWDCKYHLVFAPKYRDVYKRQGQDRGRRGGKGKRKPAAQDVERTGTDVEGDGKHFQKQVAGAGDF